MVILNNNSPFMKQMHNQRLHSLAEQRLVVCLIVVHLIIKGNNFEQVFPEQMALFINL